MDGVVALLYDNVSKSFTSTTRKSSRKSQYKQINWDIVGTSNRLITADKDGGLRHIANKIL